VGDPDFAAMQRRRVLEYRALLGRQIAAEQKAGDVGDDRDPRDEARELLALLQGIATEAAFDPDDWPPERQRAVVRRALARLRGSTEARS
jgi:hypothetical protein